MPVNVLINAILLVIHHTRVASEHRTRAQQPVISSAVAIVQYEVCICECIASAEIKVRVVGILVSPAVSIAIQVCEERRKVDLPRSVSLVSIKAVLCKLRR